MKLCVIIPAYNESNTIGGIIKAVKSRVSDVIVINDGSVDKTEDAARESGAFVISLKKNCGKGEALRYGFDYVLKEDYDAVITMDADGQHSPCDLTNIIEGAAGDKVGIVVGNRMVNPEGMPFARFVTNLFMSFMISVICRQNIPDTQCGLRLIKSIVLRKARFISSNYEIESELLIRACKLGFKIVSVPIKSVYEGQLSLINPLVDTWRFLVMLFKVLI